MQIEFSRSRVTTLKQKQAVRPKFALKSIVPYHWLQRIAQYATIWFCARSQ